MALITIIYLDGTQESFDDSKSYHGYNRLHCGDGIVTITEPYGKETTIPLALIQRIEHFKEQQY